MGFGSAFKSAWNKAGDAVQQKVAQVATTAKQVVNKTVEKVQQTAQNAATQAQAAGKFIAAQTAKASGAAQQAAQKAIVAAKKPIIQAVEKAKPQVVKAAQIAQQSAAQAAATVKQKAVSTAKKAKKTFKKIKKEFNNLRQVGKPIEACPYGKLFYGNAEGSLADGKIQGAVYKRKGANSETNLIYGTGEISKSSASAGVGVFTHSAALYTKGNPLNPPDRMEIELSALTAEARAEGFFGIDKTRVGYKIGGLATADVAGVKIKRERNINIPFTNWSLSFRGFVEPPVPAPGVGVGAGIHEYWDREEKRFHMGGFAKGKFIEGIGLGADISIGKKYTSTKRKTD